MQEKTLPNQANSTSNIHSSEFGAISYDIFGSPYQKSGSFLATDSLDFGYLGKPYNADTELYDYGFRDYSPEIARFTSVDPIRDGRNWYCYVVNDPVNYVDLWGLCGSDGEKKTVLLTIHNIDPTPNANEIIASSGEVGHTWISLRFEDSTEIYLGWGNDGSQVSDGASSKGVLLKSNSSNLSGRQQTSSYTTSITERQAQAIIEYFYNLEKNNTKYNLGGKNNDKNATMCSESVIEALKQSNSLSKQEAEILFAPYTNWQTSFPKELPADYINLGKIVKDFTAPNPNAIEYRINELTKQKRDQNEKK